MVRAHLCPRSSTFLFGRHLAVATFCDVHAIMFAHDSGLQAFALAETSMEVAHT